ncbi:amylo-alpha-1,6-glucosidase [Ornithinimicrobium tianjinense]|uniref:Amylo-alpha-1,6-glucosidase n=1 Tax=Ornithinimicrobium tianjinense TaxID=1195761 RepID=A0A917BQM2_9MICO|nr:glycogen debranching N-terminal domain-containing protein [Ornithinimicrobium tianjinense]GGF53930.1 amylo-alpha-1,6-glucosidase [Ornithinimicrobium tianjinense]
MDLQPWLHELEIAVDGPSTALSSHDGSMGAPGTGWFVDDRRVLSLLEVRLDDIPAVAVASATSGPRSLFWGSARHLGDPTPDPTVEVHRERVLVGHRLTETLTIRSRAARALTTTLTVRLGGDGADLSTVKVGRDDGGAALLDPDPGALSWADARHRTTVRCDPAPDLEGRDRAGAGPGLVLSWPLTVEPGASATVTLALTAERTSVSAFDADAGSSLLDLEQFATGGDDTWRRMLRSNLVDLQHLLLRDPEAPDDLFAAAGSPWYLTLFGRDSIWAARFLLPYTTRLAQGTLRALARRQASEDDPALAAERGKILHEVRRTAYAGGTLDLPPLYYGTVDATPLWVVLLHDSWRWGLPEAEVRELLPAMHAALGWMERMCGQADDGFLRYVDMTGTGLSNQGWKDSGDSMRRADGSIAPAPIALLEAQAYAVEAASGAADLLDALGESGGEHWRTWADALRTRVRARFWVGEGPDAYLAMALDADGHPVDGVGSNMGHALGSGLLSEEETGRVVERLMRPDMLREFGIATLSANNPAYNPAGYHTGSVWVHDTAIIVHGLARTAHREEALTVGAALVRLSATVGHRFPELIAGDAIGSRPVPYPASCRPQAWSAASAAVLTAVRDELAPPAQEGSHA